MGAQQSTSNVINDTVNKAVSNVLVTSSSSCGQNNTLESTQVFKNITADEGCRLTFSDISQTAVQSPNFTCSSDTTNDSDLAAQFKSQLQQQADARASNFPIGYAETNSTTVNKLVNDIENNISISTVSSCVQNNFLTQKQEFDTIKSSCPSYCRPNSQMCVDLAKVSPTLAGSICDMSKCDVEFKDISQSAIQSAVGNCLASNTNYQRVLGEASTDLSQTATTTNEGVDAGDIIDSIGTAGSNLITASSLPFIVIGVVVVLLVSIGAYFLLSSGGGSQFKVGPSKYLPQFDLSNGGGKYLPQGQPQSITNGFSSMLNNAPPLPQSIINGFSSMLNNPPPLPPR